MIKFRRMVKALHTLPNTSPFIEDICLGNDLQHSSFVLDFNTLRKIEELSTGWFRQKILIQPPEKLGLFRHALNEQQFQQIQTALKRKFTLIQGPPGMILSKF